MYLVALTRASHASPQMVQQWELVRESLKELGRVRGAGGGGEKGAAEKAGRGHRLSGGRGMAARDGLARQRLGSGGLGRKEKEPPFRKSRAGVEAV